MRSSTLGLAVGATLAFIQNNIAILSGQNLVHQVNYGKSSDVSGFQAVTTDIGLKGKKIREKIVRYNQKR
jgi:hypothetical protein